MTTVDWNNLKDYIGVETSDNDEFIQSCWVLASILITKAFAAATVPVPQEVLDRCALEVGAELYRRKDAPSGTSQFATFEGGSVPVRGPRDPLSQVRPIINAYVVPF